MSKNSPDPLSDLLRHWAEQQSPDDFQSERLQAQVTLALQDAAFLDLPVIPATGGGTGVPSRLLWFAAGAAAAILLAWVLPLGHRTPAPPVAREELAEAPPLVRLHEAQLMAKTRLLAAAEELFDGRLAWLAEDDRDVQLGLTDAANFPQDANPIVVRLVVLARKSGSKDWKPVWEADLVTRDEQLVELTPQKLEKSRLRLWAYALPDGKIAVDSDLVLTGGIPILSVSSGVQQSGVPRQVFSLQRDDAECRVYQTVAFLRKRVG